jgi:hypothetical protein
MPEKKSLQEIPEIDLSSYAVDPRVIDLVPANLAQKYLILPLFKVGHTLTVMSSHLKI